MENQTDLGDQNIQPVSQNPISQPNAFDKPKNNLVAMLAVGVICSLVFGAGGYFLGKQSFSPSGDQSQIVPTNPPDADNPTAISNQDVSRLPTGWSYKTNGECGVRLAVPPKEPPYYYPMDPNRQPSVTNEQGTGRFWDFPRGGVYPNLLSKLFTPKISQDYKQSVTMYTSPEEASGYISQAVSVSCIQNDLYKIIDNDEMLSILKRQIEKHNASTAEKGMEPSKYTIKNNISTTRWGKNVIDLVVTEDANEVAYTMFVTPQFVYEVKVFGATSDSSVKDTAKKIFDNLSF